MENLWGWLKRILKSAFEDSVRSIISTVIIAALSYGATLLWQSFFSTSDVRENTPPITQENPTKGPTNSEVKPST